jgi:hypothetical protein
VQTRGICIHVDCCEADPEFAGSLVKKAPRDAAIRGPEKIKAKENSALQKLVRVLLY